MSEQHYIERYWRDATPEDAICEPPMLARFRDDDGGEWKWNGRLLGIDRSVISGCFWCAKNAAFRYCQVYDAPDPGEGWRLIDIESTTRLSSDERWYPSLSKWLSPDDCYCDRYQDGCFYRRRIEPPKPDPGEGWRLIDTEKETPKNGDEFLLTPRNEWITIVEHPSRKGFAENYIYRRRIEQPKPEPRYEPFRWEDRDQLRGRIVTYVDRNRTVEFRCESFAVDDDGLIVNDAYADWLCKHAVFVDTKEPVGRRVE